MSRQMGTLSLALRSLVDFDNNGKPEPVTDERGRRLNIVRFGVSTPATPK